METVIYLTIFLALVFLPPLIAGPLPAMLIFRMAPGPNWRRNLFLLFLLTIVLNLVALVMIIIGLDDFLPPGALACTLTPVASLIALIDFLIRLRRTDSDPDADPIQRRWMRVSLVAILPMQVIMLMILIIFAPLLCDLGIRPCDPMP